METAERDTREAGTMDGAAPKPAAAETPRARTVVRSILLIQLVRKGGTLSCNLICSAISPLLPFPL